jgi:hypothetical protein
MRCQRCGKECINRTEGRRVKLAGKDLFFCNVCSLHAVTGREDGDRELICDVPRPAFRRGNWLLPP